MKRAAGFTLFELLCCIAILGILAALLTSTAVKARTKSRSAVHIAMLRQLGLSWSLYSSDFSDEYPTIAKLVRTGYAPEQVYVSPCDPYRWGWSFPYPSNAVPLMTYGRKVSILDVERNQSEGAEDFSEQLLNRPILEGWAIIPDCDATFFGDLEQKKFHTFPMALGGYKRLRFDGSVASRHMPANRNSYCNLEYFSSQPCPPLYQP